MVVAAGADNWSAYGQPLCVDWTSNSMCVGLHGHTGGREWKLSVSEKSVSRNWPITSSNILLVRAIKAPSYQMIDLYYLCVFVCLVLGHPGHGTYLSKHCYDIPTAWLLPFKAESSQNYFIGSQHVCDHLTQVYNPQKLHFVSNTLCSKCNLTRCNCS